MDNSGEAFEDKSRSDLLDCFGVLGVEERRAQARQLQAAAVWADANGRETVDPDVARLPGRPGLRFYGGQGTPYVTTGAGAEIGARLGRSTGFGDALLADSLDLRHRLPQLWRRVQDEKAIPSYARYVAKRTRDLEPEEASYVDERCADYSDGQLTWGRFADLVEAAIVAAAPAAAAAREAAAQLERFARTTRSSEHGIRGLYLRTHAGDVAKVDAMVDHLARILGDLGSAETLDQRRATAMVTLASPVEVIGLLAQYDAWKDRPTDPSAPEPADPEPEAEASAGEPVETPDGDEDAPVSPDPVEDHHGKAGPIADAIDLFRRTGDPDSLDSLGEKPLLDWAKVLPSFTVYVHLYGGRIHPTQPQSPCTCGSGGASRALVGLDRAETPEIVRIEGIGVATEAWLRAHLGIRPETKVVVRPVLDLEGQAPVDAWEIPERHREAVRVMTPADCFPWGSATVNQSGGRRSMQIDHTEAWKPDQPDGEGQSRVGNYGPMTQRHHNLKTHDGWDVKQPYPGIYVWRDPDGAFYLVDHTGTRPISRPA